MRFYNHDYGWVGLVLPKNEIAKTTPIASAFKNCTCRGKKWLLNRMREKNRFPNFLLCFCMERWRHKASKARSGYKIFYFMRKSPWGISEPAGAFGIEQAQKIIGGSKPAPWRCGLFIVLVMQGPPSHIVFAFKSLLCLELPISPNGFFKPLLDPSGGFTSETATRRVKK
jgi:hypothetical protein